MLRMPAVSGLTLRSPFSGTGTGGRRSPVEVVATMGTYLTRTHAAEISGLRAGPFGRWANGVTAMRANCVAFADHWQAHNEQVLRTAAAGPLWVVLGDSTAQGLGAPSPDGGYVGQALDALRRRSGLPWQVLNLSASGSLIRDVLHHQLPRLPASADLVTCGIGINDVLYSGPGKLFGDLRMLLAAVPDDTIVLDLPLPAGYGGLLGRASRPTWRGSTGPCTRRPLPGACRWPRCRRTSCRPGPGSSRPTASTPARTATATGPGRCSPSCENKTPESWPDGRTSRTIGCGVPQQAKEASMAREIDRDQVRRFMEQRAQIVDVLPAREYGEEHLPGAINLPLRRIEAEASQVLDPSRPVIVYCADSA